MNKLDKAIKILENRLPKTHFIPVTAYKTIYSLLKKESKLSHKGDYNKCIQWYENYFANPDTNTYMNTKYYNPPEDNKRKYQKKTFGITALAGNPICIVEQNTIGYRVKDFIFLLLHEMGHHYYGRRYNQWLQEHWCDEFAVMWTRRLIKEGML